MSRFLYGFIQNWLITFKTSISQKLKKKAFWDKKLSARKNSFLAIVKGPLALTSKFHVASDCSFLFFHELEVKEAYMKENMMAKWQEYKVWISLGVMGLLIGSGLLLVYQPAQAEQVPDVLTLASTKASSKDQASVTEPVSNKVEPSAPTSTIMVDVKGAVQQAGLYELAADSRVADAIELAGGLTEQADPKSINLAQKLVDEAVIYVATEDEAISVVAPTVPSTVSEKEQGGLVNLNTADAAQLQTISGIGAKRAQDIIAYREANGPFKTVDDLNQVSGIGDKTLENLRSYVTVD